MLTSNSGYIGGARIKRQYDYSENGGLANEKEYQYSTTLNGGISSGILMNWPRYIYFIEWKSSDGTFYQNLFLKNSSNIQQNSLDSYNIGYSKVYEINNNKGYIEHNFYSYQDYPDTFNSGEPNIRNYFDNPPISGVYPSYPNNLYKNFKNLYGVDKSIMRGKPKSDIIYPQNSVYPIKKVEYVYNDNIDYNPNNSQDENNYVSVNHLSGEWVQGYKRYFNSSALKKRITTDYLNGNSVINKTDYYYDSSVALNLTRETNTTSSNETLSKTYSYAQNINSTNSLMMQKNMIGIPLVIENKKNNIIISKTEIVYPKTAGEITNNSSGLVVPLYIQSSQINTIGSSGEIKKTDLSYDKYDSQGNLLQYTTKSGVPVSIIWGYNQTQPIAKVEGAEYSALSSSQINTIVTASDEDAKDTADGNPKEQLLLNALDGFRVQYPGYQITTYSYDPLIGVRSITPPSGIRENYIYDAANRLQSVKDINGNILKEYEYNYQH